MQYDIFCTIDYDANAKLSANFFDWFNNFGCYAVPMFFPIFFILACITILTYRKVQCGLVDQLTKFGFVLQDDRNNRCRGCEYSREELIIMRHKWCYFHTSDNQYKPKQGLQFCKCMDFCAIFYLVVFIIKYNIKI